MTTRDRRDTRLYASPFDLCAMCAPERTAKRGLDCDMIVDAVYATVYHRHDLRSNRISEEPLEAYSRCG